MGRLGGAGTTAALAGAVFFLAVTDVAAFEGGAAFFGAAFLAAAAGLFLTAVGLARTGVAFLGAGVIFLVAVLVGIAAFFGVGVAFLEFLELFEVAALALAGTFFVDEPGLFAVGAPPSSLPSHRPPSKVRPVVGRDRPASVTGTISDIRWAGDDTVLSSLRQSER